MSASQLPTIKPNSQAYTVKSFGEAYGIGRTTVFAEIAAGRLLARKLGGKTLIAAEDARRWFAELPTRGAPSVPLTDDDPLRGRS